MRLLAAVALASLAVTLIQCHQPTPTPTPDSNASAIAFNGDTVTGAATIHLAPVESGCWQLVGTMRNGASISYLPIELADSLKKEGLEVRFRGVVRHDRAGFCPGSNLELEQIAPR